jgi:hypothetical protein
MENQTGFGNWVDRADRQIQSLQILASSPIGFELESELAIYFNVFF